MYVEKSKIIYRHYFPLFIHIVKQTNSASSTRSLPSYIHIVARDSVASLKVLHILKSLHPQGTLSSSCTQVSPQRPQDHQIAAPAKHNLHFPTPTHLDPAFLAECAPLRPVPAGIEHLSPRPSGRYNNNSSSSSSSLSSSR